MNIPDDSLRKLLAWTVDTAEEELNCLETRAIVHRYVEFRLSGTGSLPADLKGVEQHLRVCQDCSEVTEAVIAALGGQKTPALDD
jgi:hypothetical protein